MASMELTPVAVPSWASTLYEQAIACRLPACLPAHTLWRMIALTTWLAAPAAAVGPSHGVREANEPGVGGLLAP